MEIELTGLRIRSWQPEDADSLTQHANNRNVWRNLRDAFPHPYTLADARAYLERATGAKLASALEVDEKAVGGISLHAQTDVYRKSFELGYWLGEPYWGRGLMTAAVTAVTEHAFTSLDATRVFASVFAWNPSSARVLEKAGFEYEGRRRLAALKDGQFVDELLFARLRQ